MKNIISPSLLFLVLFFIGCGKGGKMIENPREASFYQQYINDDSEVTNDASADIKRKINELKILETDVLYPIRLALFPNNQFYYQVDKLGTGYGEWKIHDGALQLSATRPIFDMKFYISAAHEMGNELLIRFIDRHGVNSHKINFRNPKIISLPELQDFTESSKDI